MAITNYYELALANFRSAKTLFLYGQGDEAQLNRSAYFIQQSLELAIKHILFIHGIDLIHAKTHSLPQLIKIAEENKIDLYLTDYLVERADIITDWESKTRYILGFMVAEKNIKGAIEETGKYFEILSKVIEY